MRQKELFPPDNMITLPFRSSDYAKWLATIGVNEPLAVEARFNEAFPGVDLLSEGKKAVAWNMALPPKLRKRSMPRFLSNWYLRVYVRDTVNKDLMQKTQASLTPSRQFNKGYVRTHADSDPSTGNTDGE